MISFALFILIHVGLFGFTFYEYRFSGNYKTVMSLIGYGIPVAKSAAMCVKFDLEEQAYVMIFFASVHTCAHYINFLYLGHLTLHSAIWYAWSSGPGLTGQIVTISLFLLATSAAEPIRRKQHEIFWYTHHLFLVFFAAMLFHGAFCLVKADEPPLCHFGGQFWYFFAGNGFAYAMERFSREVRGRRQTQLSKIILHPADVLEVQIKKPSAKVRSGQYIWINCPLVSTIQWHPFTLTSCPQEDFLSVHIRLVGDWTRSFAKACGVVQPSLSQKSTTKSMAPQLGELCIETLPWVMIDGPFGAASEDWMQFETVVCVGAGIGVTPFASILKAMYYTKRQGSPLTVQKVYFVWVCRETKAFEWFQTLLVTIEKEFPKFVELHLYMTGNLKFNEISHVMIHDDKETTDAVTGLSSKTIYGRPNWDQIFQKFKSNHPNEDIGVFFCGPKVLSQLLHKMANKYSDGGSEGVRFHYHKENF
ncbi:hypothetical protein HMI55_001021 [Coelomomyces lativittatus]|nr:hypothetical protein HMI55_001021 [Coelomomyces lativittatus]